MSPTTPKENLTLFESNQLVLAELVKISKLLQDLNEQAQKTSAQLGDLTYLVNGFTSGGASFNGYLPDTFTSSYVAMLAPVLADRLKKDNIGMEEMMKGGTLLTKTVLEELSAYRSEQSGKDLIAESLAFMNDPWEKSPE